VPPLDDVVALARSWPTDPVITSTLPTAGGTDSERSFCPDHATNLNSRLAPSEAPAYCAGRGRQ
jgi:hypothetical protein